ncbi:hypothetical protein Airi02_062520 [Actinoallomurus iriomotensis]|uniref:PPM-type phosphatase domain-containing protein n=1 Tax=Actinoallomurus iriomotensis TaxID=478107 RepID=A0A9W6S737_9ACTN|nr:hypothetical protein Airi02_062520 [Actinoallomurus iriomotensis]
MAALTTLNSVLLERYGHEGRFCTARYGVLTPDAETFTVDLAGGGHPPTLILRGTGDAEYLSTPGGLLVGVLPEATFATARTVLGPGDTLLLYTDGLTEARTGEERRLFGQENLRDFAAGLAPVEARSLVTALTGPLNDFGDGLQDDTALLALGVPGRPRSPA